VRCTIEVNRILKKVYAKQKRIILSKNYASFEALPAELCEKAKSIYNKALTVSLLWPQYLLTQFIALMGAKKGRTLLDFCFAVA
jgi:hypothetical protein